MPRNRITPFWHRLGAIYLFPFRPPAIGLLVAVALLNTVVPSLLGGGILALVLVLVVNITLYKYGYDALFCAADGDLDPPPVRESLAGSGYGLPFMQIGVLLLLILLVVAVAAIVSTVFEPLGALAAFAGFVLVMLAIPAVTILLALERSFASAVNPARLWETATRIGWAYLGMCGLLFVIQLMAGTVSYLVEVLVPAKRAELLTLILLSFFSSYFLLLAFHLMGYVVYQYHEALGYPVTGEETDDDLALFDELVANGRYDAALVELERLLEERPQDPDLRRRLTGLLPLVTDPRGLARHGEAVIAELLRARRAPEAAALFLRCKEADPRFDGVRPDDRARVAEQLRADGQYREALALADGFHKSHPEHPDVPRLYVLAARILLDDAGQPGKAQRILDFLRKQYPRHPQSTEVDTLLRSIQSGAGG